MKLWNQVEQYFKQNGLHALERLIGVPKKSPYDIDLNSIKRILIVRQHDQLGDFLLSTPVFRALREKFPTAYIVVVTRGYTEEVARNNIYIDKVIPFYEIGYKWNVKAIRKFIKQIRVGFDLAIVLNTVSHSLSSDLIAYFSRSRYILGSEHHLFTGTQRNFFYHLEAPYQSGVRNQSERNLDIIRFIGVDTDDRTENIHISEDELQWAKDLLANKGVNSDDGFVLVHPGAGKKDNRWEPAKFAYVANHLSEKFGLKIAVTWGPIESELGQKVIELLNDSVSVSGLKLRELAALIAVSKLFLCNDTGVMHIAAAVNTPLVAVFGPTDPVEWKPIGDRFVAIRNRDQLCSSVNTNEVMVAAEQVL